MEKLLENFAKSIAALSAAMILLSVVHEFGYFAYVGSFFQTFVTATDYFTNAILWMPIGIITIFGWQAWRFILEDPPKIQRNNWKSWIAPLFLVGGPVSIFVFTSSGFPLFYLVGLGYLWIILFDRFVPKVELAPLSVVELRKLLRIGVPIIAAIFTLGYERAKADLDLRTNSQPYIIGIKDVPTGILRIPLRHFDKGLLLSNPVDHRIEFVKWEKVDQISKPTEDTRIDPPSCAWFRILCARSWSSP
ncbi:hypothetical protein S58_36330 [Bradyrhizobium oligotrophicum S58]|uniref:Uncharacterized protein n=1 Tax=Bradyrhizobium oligotrophicum S58 TaxID=1245469 RepID=M4Z8T7_9BRAD|nr:hypothetical protein [Bradyrhizobium oligotrophicum]BAM89626.1 hypothetical protein S58_36330 [Bradyrhizobium oligotrophicum S58]